MSNQIVISSGAKVRELEGVLTGTAGVVNALGINVPSGIPQLDGSGKILVSQLPNSVMEYKGSWNAATNTPTLVNGTGNAGDVYLCEVAGTVNFGAGPITFAVGDQVIYSGTIWQRASGATGTVTSVAVTESGDALTITGSPITTSGTINIGFAGTSGQYINGAGGLTTFPSLSGFVPYTGATGSVDLGIYSLSAGELNIEKNGANTSAINFEQATGTSILGAGYTSIGPIGTDGVTFFFGGATNSLTFKNNLLSASRSYSLPDITGTLALLEGEQTFSGNKEFTGLASFTNANGTYTQYGITLTKGSAPTGFFTSNVSIYADAGVTNLVIANHPTYKSKLQFQDVATLTSNYTYTFPAATGTLALTSNLSAYLPLAGGTLTGGLIGTTGSFSSSGGSDTFAINHSSGSGIALNITKGGNGEGLYINKTSGSGNAATIIGTLNATTLVKNGGTSSQFLKADGSVDSSTYLTTSAASSTYVPYTGATTDLSLGNNTLLSMFVFIEGNGTSGGILSFKQYGTSFQSTTNHTNIFATDTDKLSFNFHEVGGGRQITFNVSSITAGTIRTYTMPNASGTIALLSGTQTFTGATTFSSSITVSGISVGTAGNGSNIKLGDTNFGAITTGSNNIAIGSSALSSITTSNANIGIGNSALASVVDGAFNIALGFGVGASITSGSNNTLFGYGAGQSITTGNYNTILGAYAGTAAMSNNIVLADGQGNIRYQWNGTNNVFTGAATFSSTLRVEGSFGIIVNATDPSLYFNNVAVQWRSYLKTSNNNYAFSDAVNDVLTLGYNGSASFFQGGNVGIGTTSPSGASGLALAINGGSNQTRIALKNSTTGDGAGNGLQILLDAGSLDAAIENRENGSLRFATGGGERMRITSGGNVGIGTSSPSGKLSLYDTSDLWLNIAKGSSFVNIGVDSTGTFYNTNSNHRWLYNSGSNEAMRITSGGQVQIKQGANSYNEGLRFINTNSNHWTFINNSGNDLYLGYNGADRGYFANATGVYVAVSDINKKKDFELSTIGLDAILGLKPTLYRMKSDDTEGNKELGFIAQEVKEFIPQAYAESGDFIGLNYNAIVAALVKSVQELKAEIDELKNK